MLQALSHVRGRSDRCPGVFRPWPAEDGALVRLRPVGGRVESSALRGLVGVAETYGSDGRVHLTRRANLQLRGLPFDGDRIPGEVVAAIEATGLLPSRSHELIRNIMVSPQNEYGGGRARLRQVATELDGLLCQDPRLAELPGRFLFVLDDGRGDLLDRKLDLGLIAVSSAAVQLRIGSTGWGAVVPLRVAPQALVALAHKFLDRRGEGPSAAWHVDELDVPLETPCERHPGTEVAQAPLASGDVVGGHHVLAPEGVDGNLAARVAERSATVVITPWRGLLIPAGDRQ